MRRIWAIVWIVECCITGGMFAVWIGRDNPFALTTGLFMLALVLFQIRFLQPRQ